MNPGSPKYLVVNGLYRSGTTMLERLIGSQQNMVCFGGIFEMPQIIAEINGFGDRNQLFQSDLTLPEFQLQEDYSSRYQLKEQLMKHISSILQLYHSHEAYKPQHQDDVRVYGLKIDDYFKVLKEIVAEDTPEKRNPLSYFSDVFPHHELIATKWTGSHGYAPVFLENEDCYWYEIVRNPRDRYVSAKLSHGENVFNSVELGRENLRFSSEFSHPRYKVTKYEDFCESPNKHIQELSEWLGVVVKDVDLVNLYGDPFQPNSSKNITEGKKYNDHSGSKQGIVSVNDQSWKDQHISDVENEIIQRGIGENSFYSLTGSGTKARFLARLKIMKNGLLKSLRSGVHKMKIRVKSLLAH